MADTLRLHLSQDRLPSAFNALDLALTSQPVSKDGPEFRINVANSLWGQENHGFLEAFLDVLSQNYGEEVREVDFKHNHEDARIRINDWVSEETGERIKDLISPGAVSPYTRLVLANAIYFSAAWRMPFEESITTRLPFFRLDGGGSEVPMMRQKAEFGYTSGEGYQAVELPYEGGEMAMTILLPDSGRFGAFEESIVGSTMEVILGGLETRLVRLTMPKFEVESSFSLSDALDEMGMPDAFDEKSADFSGMDGLSCHAGDDECLLITDVLHQAFISVDESGTEATAATAVIVEIPKSLIVEPEPIELTVDRPFIFLLRDRTTGAVLFVGRVLHPG